MCSYDLLILTNGPGFYKVDLFNELSKTKKIKVIFQARGSNIRDVSHSSFDIQFDYDVIYEGIWEERSKFLSLFKTLRIILKTNYKLILHSGWESPELIPLAFFLPKKKNGIVIESSILETKKTGLIWWLKKRIIKRMSYAFPSGKLQEDILKLADFKGEVRVTQGVGLPRKPNKVVERKGEHCTRYLFIGRLAKEKNILKLIEVFNQTNRLLTIVGHGPMIENIKNASGDTVSFLGHIKNTDLTEVFNDHDCFILPSISEPWGLVVEEALMHKIPVIVSSNVGCKYDLVQRYNSGLIFELERSDSLLEALDEMESNYQKYQKNIEMIDFEKLKKMKLKSYCIEVL